MSKFWGGLALVSLLGAPTTLWAQDELPPDMPQRIQLSEQQIDVAARFLTGIWKTYRSMAGGTVFKGARRVFEATGLTKREHCAETRTNLATVPDSGRKKLVVAMLEKTKEMQQAGAAELEARLSQRLKVVHSEGKLAGYSNTPAVGSVAKVLAAPGVMDCLLLALLDKTRLLAYAAFFGVTFVGFSWLTLTLSAQAMLLVRVGASVTVPPVLFSVNLFVFYLFYQQELDPIFEILSQGGILS